MSAKLLYSLSNEEQNLKKQIGCMNGLLQFLDPHHFINNRIISSSPRFSQGENKQERAIKNGSKRSKDKHLNVIKEKQVNPIEASRLSISSTGSTGLSLSEYDGSMKNELSPFAETVDQERHYQGHRENPSRQPSSPSKMSRYFHKKHVVTETAPSPIEAPREVVRYDQKHMDSPRLSNMSRPESPRLATHNESFRSINSNHSSTAITPRSKDFARLSYDGRETRDGHISSLKLKDLPRLSLDSKQRTRKVPALDSKDDLLVGDLRSEVQGSNRAETEPPEPMSYRAPSNIVAKLMGLEALPDNDLASPNKSREQPDGFRNVQSCDTFSRSSRNIDENKVDRELHSPRYNSKESGDLGLNKAESEQTASTDQEAQSEPKHHPLTVYGAMEKRLADLDFQKSGKDLRALKQILESMHKEKNKLEIRLENQSSHSASKSSNSSPVHITQNETLRKANSPKIKDGNRSVKDDTATRESKPNKLVKGSREEANKVVQDKPLKKLQRLRIVQEPIHGTKVAVKKKSAKDFKETHHTENKYSGERTPRSMRASKASEHMTKGNVTSSARSSDARSSPATTSGSRIKKSPMGYSEFSNDSPCLSRVVNASSLLSQSNSSMVSHMTRVVKNAEESCMKYENLQQVSDKNKPDGIQGDTALEELRITAVKEQPSPVSVLDANFFEDESPSPVRKKPTAFRDFETNAATEAEWNFSDPTYSSDKVRPGLSYVSYYQKLENFKESAPVAWKSNSYQRRNSSNDTPLHMDVNMERSYVHDILLASGFLDHSNNTMAEHIVHQPQEAISPNLFFVLEQTKRSSFSDKRSTRMTRTNERHRRRLLFDAVNEILSQQHSQPKPIFKNQSENKTNGPQLLHEIFKQIDQLQPINLPHSFDDEEDFLTTIIGKDMKHRSANWTDVSGEIPALVLDIERLIFKDLIVELVHSEATQTRKHRKQ